MRVVEVPILAKVSSSELSELDQSSSWSSMPSDAKSVDIYKQKFVVVVVVVTSTVHLLIDRH